MASAAARFTALVVLPTPPFWLATVMTRRRGGLGSVSFGCSMRVARAASSAIGVHPDTAGRGLDVLVHGVARALTHGVRSSLAAPRLSRHGIVLFHVKQSSLRSSIAQDSRSLRDPSCRAYDGSRPLASAARRARPRRWSSAPPALHATPLDHRERTTGTRDRGAVARHLVVGALTLERDEPATRPKQGSAPVHSRASGATARAVTTSAPASCCLMAGSSARPRTTVADSAEYRRLPSATPPDEPSAPEE